MKLQEKYRNKRGDRVPAAAMTTFQCLLLVGVAALALGASGVSAGAPEIILEGSELQLNAGDMLNISCRDNQPIAWCTDHTLTTEPFLETYEANQTKPYVSTLTISAVNYSHVGFLTCLHNTTQNRQEGTCDITQPDATSVYLYVKDETKLLAKEAKLGYYSATVGQPFIVPCKPTFPSVKIDLDKYSSSNDYDPYYGFIETSEEPLEVYTCSAAYEGNSDVGHMVFNFIPPGQQNLGRPVVEAQGVWQENPLDDGEEERNHYDVEEGQAVNLTCEYEMGASQTSVTLEWKKIDRFENGTGRHKLYRQPLPTDNKKIRHYEITDAKEVDTGEYHCTASLSKKYSEPAIIFLNVVKRHEMYLNMEITHPNITQYESEIIWRVYYRAHPEPEFEWYKGNAGEKLLDSSRDKVGDKRHDLKIRSFRDGELDLIIENPTLSDIGQYTLEASIMAGNGKKMLIESGKMFFIMPAKPQDVDLTVQPQQEMHKENNLFHITCDASGYPKPDINLEFRKCSSKDKCEDYFVQNYEGEILNELHRATTAEDMKQKVHSIVKWTGRAKVPGYYRCTASNNQGNFSTTQQQFFVTDGEDTSQKLSMEVIAEGKKEIGGFVKTTVVEGATVTVMCRANKLQTAQGPVWEAVNNKWTGLTNESRETELSYISEINIHSITKEMQNFSLSCKVESENATVSIQVISMLPPSWKGSVASPLEPHYQLQISENLTLTCPVDGEPKPVITWYKNGEELKTQSHTKIAGERISFDFLKETDSGKYECKAKSRAGNITADATIEVLDPDAMITTYILIVVGILIFVLVIVIGCFCKKIYQDRKRALDLQLKEQQMFNEGDPASLNPQISLDQQAELLPYNTKYEVPRDSIIFDKLLGAGAFGRVYRATAINLLPGQARTTVAVKMMKSRTDSAQLKALRSEVKIMIHIGRHINIVNLLGAHSKDLASKGELLLLVEYCKYGNILDHMHHHRKEYINQINEEDKIDPSITELRIRQRSGSGSRGRRSLKYAHLTFNQNSVQYTPGHTSDSMQEILQHSPSPLHSPGIMHGPLETFRTRTTSSSSNPHMMSDMTTMTFESSNGGSDGYISSREVGGHPHYLCSKDLLCWAYQIAKGMEYLAFKKVLHGDLAARNVLLAEDNVVKISDFGLAKDIYKNENYKKKSDGPVPVKWLALECLQDGVFSTQSDVWSFGVVLWEIFSLGQVPYPGVEYDENFVSKLEKGVRLEQPRYSTYSLYRLMLECWSNEPMDRPTFTDLEQSLGEMLGDAQKQYYLELNQPYQEDNPESSFLDMFQSQDYCAKVQQTDLNLDEDGYEMPFSPSPFCAIALPPVEVHNSKSLTPRLTPMQMEYLQQNSAAPSPSTPDGVYLSMSSPTRQSQTVFNFDQEIVTYIARRDSEIMQERDERGIDVVDSGDTGDIYLKMDSGPKDLKSVNQEHSPGDVSLASMSGITRSRLQNNPNTNLNLANPPVLLRQKLVRHLSEMEKHDSGLYSPTALMQTNPGYMVMNGFPKTDENNYISKEDTYDLKNNTANSIYENFQTVKNVNSPINRDYLKGCKTSEEYVNLIHSDINRNRTVSEASSGLGSINDESPPLSRENPSLFKSSLKENAIIEESVLP